MQHDGTNRRWLVLTTSSAMVLWGLLVGFSLYWNIGNLREQELRLAIAEARSNWNKDMAFRSWASRHGGVYVKQDKRTPPNPYLSHLSKRDVRLDDGTELTLMNPAYMMRQMTDEYEAIYGIKGKATGKIVINPENSPDEWERMALQRFEMGEDEVVEEVTIDGKPFMRYMKSVLMEESCLQCHGYLGFKEGDVRGGVSVSIPLTPYMSADKTTARSIIFTHIIVWVFGLCGILLFSAVVWNRHRENRKLLRQIEHEALHDILTGLANRKLLLERVDKCIARSHREEGYHFSVCFVDLDRFKLINDSYGHQLGDKILVEVAKRLQPFVQPTDMVARLGGDEFILLLESTRSLEETLQIAERVLESLREVIIVDGMSIHTDASIGICCTSTHYTRAEEMIRDADNAMYRAKDEGRGRIEFFDPVMHKRAVTIMHMESELHHALERGELQIAYQPIIDTRNRRVGGFEALLRWYHPVLGAISPAEFIPVAESTGLIRKIGSWVVREACHQVHAWNLQYGHNFFISVNISGKQLADKGIVESVRQALSSSKLPAGMLHCEITETTLVRHKELASKVLAEIQQLGAKVSIDDFGTGYSSLTYLHQFSFDILKIDRSFVQDMTVEGKGMQLVRMLMMLARDFNMEVIAEGVETEEQYNCLKSFHCAWVQGFYFVRPIPAEMVVTMIEAGSSNCIDTLVEWHLHNATTAIS